MMVLPGDSTLGGGKRTSAGIPRGHASVGARDKSQTLQMCEHYVRKAWTGVRGSIAICAGTVR